MDFFLYRITFLPCSYEAKVKNKNFFFPREEKILFFPVSPKTKKIGAGKKVIPCIEKEFCNQILQAIYTSCCNLAFAIWVQF